MGHRKKWGNVGKNTGEKQLLFIEIGLALAHKLNF